MLIESKRPRTEETWGDAAQCDARSEKGRCYRLVGTTPGGVKIRGKKKDLRVFHEGLERKTERKEKRSTVPRLLLTLEEVK